MIDYATLIPDINIHVIQPLPMLSDQFKVG